MRVLLNTGRTVPQGDTVERKHSPAYEQAISVCYVNPVDMMELMIEDGDHVRIRSTTGSVVVRCSPSEAVSRGSVFVPLGPFANHLISGGTHSTGMPDFKTTLVEIEGTDEAVPSLASIMASYGGLAYDH